MKNIPIFTTQLGVASLTLDQIAFNRMAYIRIQSSEDPALFSKECLDFCKAVGAQEVYITGIDLPDSYPKTAVIRMKRKREGLETVELAVVPVDDSTKDLFRDIYNNRMNPVSHASGMSQSEMVAVVQQRNGYLVYEGRQLLGIGIADGAWIRSIIATQAGAGEAVLLALNQKLEGNEINVELVDTNHRAKRLYERLGFAVTETVSVWYKIF